MNLEPHYNDQRPRRPIRRHLPAVLIIGTLVVMVVGGLWLGWDAEVSRLTASAPLS